MQCIRCNVPMIWLHGYDLRRCNYEDEANITEFIGLTTVTERGRIIKRIETDNTDIKLYMCPTCGLVEMHVDKSEIKHVLRNVEQSEG